MGMFPECLMEGPLAGFPSSKLAVCHGKEQANHLLNLLVWGNFAWLCENRVESFHLLGVSWNITSFFGDISRWYHRRCWFNALIMALAFLLETMMINRWDFGAICRSHLGEEAVYVMGQLYNWYICIYNITVETQQFPSVFGPMWNGTCRGS